MALTLTIDADTITAVQTAQTSRTWSRRWKRAARMWRSIYDATEDQLIVAQTALDAAQDTIAQMQHACDRVDALRHDAEVRAAAALRRADALAARVAALELALEKRR